MNRRGFIGGLIGLAGALPFLGRSTAAPRITKGPTHKWGQSALFVCAESGDDHNPGTPAAPLRTMHEAMRRATSGTTVNLSGGRFFPVANQG